jgi:hypothetical protein
MTLWVDGPARWLDGAAVRGALLLLPSQEFEEQSGLIGLAERRPAASRHGRLSGFSDLMLATHGQTEGRSCRRALRVWGMRSGRQCHDVPAFAVGCTVDVIVPAAAFGRDDIDSVMQSSAAEALWALRPSAAPIMPVEIKAKRRALLTISCPMIWRGVLNIG